VDRCQCSTVGRTNLHVGGYRGPIFDDDARSLISKIVIRSVYTSSTTTGVVEQEEGGDGQDPVLFTCEAVGDGNGKIFHRMVRCSDG